MKKTLTSALLILLAIFSLTTKAQHHLYGVCSEGGPDNIGGIFHYSPASGLQTFDHAMQTVVYGGTPQYASLFDAGNGKFYGTTKDGSNIYEWDSLTNVYTVKHVFDYNEGYSPRGAMIKSGTKLFGLTEYGGTFGRGAIYSWNPISNICEARASFNGSNGENPLGSLIELGGKFYGISIRGGASNEGALFEFDSITNTITKKFDFGGTNGVNPFGTLKAYAGKLYGMCHTGGANNNGVIFEWDPSTDTFTKKIDLLMATGGITEGSLTLDGTVFYGTTLMGGALGGGVIFEWDPATNIYTVRMEIGSIGAMRPKGDLVKYGSKYYATTENGGAYGGGVIYEWDPVGNTLTKKIDLHPETGDNGYSALTLSNNKFYGNTNQGGAGGKGVIFQWDPATNVYTPKIHFSENNGSKAKGKLTYHSGKFYGMTQEGGKYNGGVIFEWDPIISSYTVKVNLNSTTGKNPYGSLVFYGGKFYAAAAFGGANAAGTIFEWDPATNILTKKYDFNFTDGHYPFGTMSMSGGKFYGTTYQGGAYGGGAIYEWDPVGNIYTKKHDLNPSSDGMGPQGGMTLLGGMFYGLTNTGGSSNVGTLYEWDPVGNIFTKKVDLISATGSAPIGNLTEFAGKLYGMTSQGGANSHGVIFEWDPVGNIYTSKVDLQISATGGFPSGTMRLFNSKFYGAIEAGGSSSRGTLFEWDPVSNIFTTTVNFAGTNGGAPGYGELSEICATLPAPTDVTPAANLTICEGNSTTLSVSGEGTISWYDAPTGGTNLGSGSSFVTPVLSSSTSYYAEAFSDCGTGASASRTEIIVTVNPIPTITIAAPTSACENTATTLTASGADYYVWVSGGTSDVEIVYPTILVSVTTITVNTYTVTGTDLNGCSNTVSHLINAEEVPTVMISGNISVCDGESTTLTATGADSYVWSSGGISDIEIISPTFSDTYSVTGTSLNGCSNSYTEYITVNPLPMVNASGKMFMCEGETLMLMAMGADSYVWSSGGLTDTESFSPSTTTGYSVTGTDLNGCTGMDSFTITVNSNPVINVTGTTTLCEGESTLLTATGADSYSWSTGSFSDTETVSPTTSTTYTVSGTNAALCYASVDVPVTVNTIPFISALSTSTYNCSGEPITLTGTAAKTDQQQTLDSYYFIATTTDRMGQSFIATESAPLKSIVVNFVNFDVNPGTFVFELFDGEGFGGTSIFVATHTNVPLNEYVINTLGVNVVNGQSYTWSIYTIAGVNQAYIASKDSDPYPFGEAYYSPDLVSAGTPTTEDLWFKTIIETSAPHTYTWDNSVIDGIPYFATVGTNTYTVTGLNAFGCSGTGTIEIVTIPSPVMSIDNPVICEGDVTTITVSGTDAYEWSTGSTNTAIVTNPLVSTTYVVTGTAINGCTATIISTVTVNALPAVVANATLSTLCAGETTTLTGSGALNYTWDNSVIDNVAFNPSATQTYTVTGTDANLCVNTDDIIVTVNALPTVSLSTFSPVCFSVGTYTLTGGTPAGGTYSGTNITGNIMDVSTLSGFNAVTYQYTDGNGCTNTNNENIFVEAGGNVTGIINANGVPITNGEAYLFEYSNGVRMDTLSTVTLSGTAAFTFTNVGSGSYLIFAKPAITNNNGAYNGGATFWQNATPFSINCTETLTFTIETTTSTPLSGGTATLSGRVQEGDFFGSGKTDAIGDPIPGVDISLEQNPGGIIISTTQTDANGDYRFNNVNEGSYRILADIPGTPTVSVHSVDVVGANNWINLDYYVDSNQIYINPNTTPVLAGIKATKSGVAVSVYPNPTHGEFMITSDKNGKQIGIRIVDVLGKELLKMNSNTIYTKIDINDQPNGIYFVEISGENSLQHTFKISKQ